MISGKDQSFCKFNYPSVLLKNGKTSNKNSLNAYENTCKVNDKIFDVDKFDVK